MATYDLHVPQMLPVPRMNELITWHVSQIHDRLDESQARDQALRNRHRAKWVEAVARLVDHETTRAHSEEETSQSQVLRRWCRVNHR